jgi:hypothetical protein
VSKKLKKRQKCVVVPIGGLSIGFCRHRAILFKVALPYYPAPVVMVQRNLLGYVLSSSAIFNFFSENVQVLADFIGLPCRIAQGCKYCSAPHRSSCLVKVDSERRYVRSVLVRVLFCT